MSSKLDGYKKSGFSIISKHSQGDAHHRQRHISLCLQPGDNLKRKYLVAVNANKKAKQPPLMMWRVRINNNLWHIDVYFTPTLKIFKKRLASAESNYYMLTDCANTNFDSELPFIMSNYLKRVWFFFLSMKKYFELILYLIIGWIKYLIILTIIMII